MIDSINVVTDEQLVTICNHIYSMLLEMKDLRVIVIHNGYAIKYYMKLKRLFWNNLRAYLKVQSLDTKSRIKGIMLNIEREVISLLDSINIL